MNPGLQNRRILVIDDNPSIHEDFRKILAEDSSRASLDAMRAALFEDIAAPPALESFIVEFAHQGQAGYGMVQRALEQGEPYAVAFVDMRMPPGWDGVETIERLWQADPDLQVVICTAHSDLSWEEVVGRLGRSQQLLILRKPFDSIEVWQLARSLAEKWELARERRTQLVEMQKLVELQTGELSRANEALKRDNEQMRRVKSELAEARDKALSAVRAKAEFLASMSHEIRTPMNGIIGIGGLLLATELSEQQREYAETVQRSAEALLTLLNDILDLSKVESGRLELQHEPFALDQLVEDVAGLLAPKASEKDLELLVNYSPCAPRRWVGDAIRIRQVLLNLVSNAIKFTAYGHVEIRVEMESGQLRVSVRDTGEGIAAPDQKAVFEKFTQLSQEARVRHGGAGLGLPISKRLVEMMGGQIGLLSRPGAGSTFWVLLPSSGEPSTVPSRDPGVVLRVLLAGVNPLVAALASEVILGQCADGSRNLCDCASTLGETLEALTATERRGVRYDFVVFDSTNSCFDHEPLLECLRTAEPSVRPKAIALVNLYSRSDLTDLKQKGCTACLSKPVHSLRLFDLMSETLRRNGMRAGAEAIRTPTITTNNGLPHPHLRVLVAEDNVVNQKVASRLLEKLGCQVDLASDGRQAVERCRETPYDLVFMDCHMPEMDGYQATEAIRTWIPAGNRPAIVALTADAMPGNRDKCFAAGMDDVLTKPVRITDMEYAIRHWAPTLEIR